MNNNQSARIKAIHVNHKMKMIKFLNEDNTLKACIENELNHNLFINDNIADTLSDIESVMEFIMIFTTETALNKKKELEPYEQDVINLLSNSAIKALRFEKERACHMMKNNHSGEL